MVVKKRLNARPMRQLLLSRGSDGPHLTQVMALSCVMNPIIGMYMLYIRAGSNGIDIEVS